MSVKSHFVETVNAIINLKETVDKIVLTDYRVLNSK